MNSILGIKLYGKTLKLRPGAKINISIIYTCNIKPFLCTYCALSQPANNRATAKISTLGEWKRFFNYFPIRIREVLVEGGETTLVPYMPELVNWLLHDKGYHVTLFSYLPAINPFLRIKPNYRFQITSTYHHQDDLIRFLAIYKELTTEGYRVNVDEINTGEPDWKQVIEFSRVKPVQGNKELEEQMIHHRKEQHFNFSPDQNFYLGCYDEFLAKGRK